MKSRFVQRIINVWQVTENFQNGGRFSLAGWVEWGHPCSDVPKHVTGFPRLTIPEVGFLISCQIDKNSGLWW